MKKTLLYAFFSSALLGTNLVKAQIIPNPGFETWVNNTESGSTYEVPQKWIALDLMNRAFNPNYTGSAVTKTTQSHSGTYAALMQTVINGGDTAAGYLVSVNSLADYMSALFSGGALGFTYAQRPANITGYYKFTSVGGDMAAVSVILTKWNTSLTKRDTVGVAYSLIATNASVYTSFSAPVTYSFNLMPDTAVVFAGLIGPGNTHVGSQFFLDDVAFTGSVPFGIEQLTHDNRCITVYPNPLSSKATFNIDPAVLLTQTEIIIYDVMGKIVKQLDKVDHQTTFEKGDLQPGVYFYQLVNGGVVVSHGKFMIE